MATLSLFTSAVHAQLEDRLTDARPISFTDDPSSELSDLRKRLEVLEKAGSGEKKFQDARKWTTRLGGHIQMDYIMWANADPAITDAQNYFNYRRLRLVADGEGYEQFDFRLQLTLEPGQLYASDQFGSPDVKDAYFSITDISGLGRFRVGNFFVPFSLEQVTNDTNNIFLERSIPTQGVFAADREVGVALYNCTDDERFTWTFGAFFDNINDTVKTRFDDNQGLRLSGRLTWLPYYDESSEGRYLVHTGVGILHTQDHDNLVVFRARPQVHRGPFVLVSQPLLADSYTTGNLELAVVRGPVTLQSEAFISQVNLLNGETRHTGGAYAHLSYFLTGENRVFEPFGQHGPQFGRNRPHCDLKLKSGCRQWGAIEAKVRWSYLDLTQVAGGQYNDLSVGFNWYWSDRTRWMFDWIHPMTTADSIFGTTQSDLLGLRFDVNW
ncbi:MAG: hypothetical protein KF851_13330 [Pirellulaceae bacterium]|nr:hypothetical protein [Pirellulaceae bacterium]